MSSDLGYLFWPKGSGEGLPDYEQLKHRREVAKALAAREKRGYPKTFGEGLTYLGESAGQLIGDLRMEQLRKQQQAYERQRASGIPKDDEGNAPPVKVQPGFRPDQYTRPPAARPATPPPAATPAVPAHRQTSQAPDVEEVDPNGPSPLDVAATEPETPGFAGRFDQAFAPTSGPFVSETPTPNTQVSSRFQDPGVQAQFFDPRQTRNVPGVMGGGREPPASNVAFAPQPALNERQLAALQPRDPVQQVAAPPPPNATASSFPRPDMTLPNVAPAATATVDPRAPRPGEMPVQAARAVQTAPVSAPPASGAWRDSPAAVALRGMEAGGSKDPYRMLHAWTKGDRAHGAYGIMGKNIGPWSKDALGRAVSKEEFLANDKIQDAVAEHRFNYYANKYGSPELAARAWYAGERGMKNLAATDIHKRLNVAQYGQDFLRRSGEGGGAPPTAVAGGGAAAPPNARQEVAAVLAANPDLAERALNPAAVDRPQGPESEDLAPGAREMVAKALAGINQGGPAQDPARVSTASLGRLEGLQGLGARPNPMNIPPPPPGAGTATTVPPAVVPQMQPPDFDPFDPSLDPGFGTDFSPFNKPPAPPAAGGDVQGNVAPPPTEQPPSTAPVAPAPPVPATRVAQAPSFQQGITPGAVDVLPPQQSVFPPPPVPGGQQPPPPAPIDTSQGIVPRPDPSQGIVPMPLPPDMVQQLQQPLPSAERPVYPDPGPEPPPARRIDPGPRQKYLEGMLADPNISDHSKLGYKRMWDELERKRTETQNIENERARDLRNDWQQNVREQTKFNLGSRERDLNDYVKRQEAVVQTLTAQIKIAEVQNQPVIRAKLFADLEKTKADTLLAMANAEETSGKIGMQPDQLLELKEKVRTQRAVANKAELEYLQMSGLGSTEERNTVLKSFEKQHEKVSAAPKLLEATKIAHQALDEGAITGIGADPLYQWNRVMGRLGMPEAQKRATATETLVSAWQPITAGILRETSGTSQLSEGELRFARDAAAGRIELTEQTMRRMLDIYSKRARFDIANYNEKLDAAYKHAPHVKDALRVEMPVEPYHIDMLVRGAKDPKILEQFNSEYGKGEAQRQLRNRGLLQ